MPRMPTWHQGPQHTGKSLATHMRMSMPKQVSCYMASQNNTAWRSEHWQKSLTKLRDGQPYNTSPWHKNNTRTVRCCNQNKSCVAPYAKHHNPNARFTHSALLGTSLPTSLTSTASRRLHLAMAPSCYSVAPAGRTNAKGQEN